MVSLRKDVRQTFATGELKSTLSTKRKRWRLTCFLNFNHSHLPFVCFGDISFMIICSYLFGWYMRVKSWTQFYRSSRINNFTEHLQQKGYRAEEHQNNLNSNRTEVWGEVGEGWVFCANTTLHSLFMWLKECGQVVRWQTCCRTKNDCR